MFYVSISIQIRIYKRYLIIRIKLIGREHSYFFLQLNLYLYVNHLKKLNPDWSWRLMCSVNFCESLPLFNIDSSWLENYFCLLINRDHRYFFPQNLYFLVISTTFCSLNEPNFNFKNHKTSIILQTSVIKELGLSANKLAIFCSCFNTHFFVK